MCPFKITIKLKLNNYHLKFNDKNFKIHGTFEITQKHLIFLITLLVCISSIIIIIILQLIPFNRRTIDATLGNRYEKRNK